MNHTKPHNPRFAAFNKLIGEWEVTNKDPITGEEWFGHDKYEWLEGGYFIAFHHEEFGRLKGTMIIGYETRWGQAKPTGDAMGHWFETSSGSHYDYIWEIDGKHLTLWLEQKEGDSALRADFNDTFTELKGSWKWPGGGYATAMKKVTK
jgi:hypothetical protein